MRWTKTIKRMCVAAVSGAMLMSMLPAMPASAAGVCTINTNKTYQYIRGFGGIDMQEWQGYSLSEAERARVFGNGDGQLGLTILRVFVNPDKNKWNLALPVAKYASEHGVTVFATPWEPPSNLAESGGTNGKLHLPERNYGAYATHLNDFGTYMKNNGVDLYSISVQNEPDYAHEWTYWSPTETTNFIANYGDRITSTRLMSPESFQYGAWNNGKDYYKNILNNAKAFANTDVFGTHFYGTKRNHMDFPALENCGKEIWMTEVYTSSDANSANNWPQALDVAENIHDGLVVGNMSVYTWWYIKRSYSLIEQSGNNGAITKRGYMMAQYSKYVRPGDFRIDCTESPDSNLLISAYKHSDSQIEVVAINKGTSDVSQQFSVGNREITKVDRYRSSQNENLAKTANLDHKTSTYWANLPAKSVSTFVINLKSDGVQLPDDPQPHTGDPITPDANGYYYHDTFEDSACDWEARGTTEPTLSGRHPYQGTNALLAQKREKAWHGLQKTLDPNTFKGGQKYSFSVCVDYEEGEEQQSYYLSLQYDDASGTTKYAHIADGTTYPGQYLQLANSSYQIPSDATNLVLYVESTEGTGNFYIDEAIVAKDGTKISGPEAPKPQMPSNPTVTYTAGDGSVTLNWNAVNGADLYAVYQYINNTWTKVAECSGTSYVLNNLASGSEYKVSVIVKANGSWNNDYSNAITVTPKASSNNNPYPVVTSSVTGNTIRLSWGALSGAEKYGVAYYSAGKWKILNGNISASTTSFIKSGVPNGTYKLVVCAKFNGEWDIRNLNSRAFTVTVK